MALRRDKVQLNIEFVTNESRSIAKANQSTKALTKELRKAVAEGGDVADVMRRIEAAGSQVENIDLSKVVPAQLITRAKQLGQVLKQIPESNPKYAQFNGELKRINDRLANIRQSSRGVADSFKSKNGVVGAMQRVQVLTLAALAALTAFWQTFRQLISATGQVQKFQKQLEKALGSKSAAQSAFRQLQGLADELKLPAGPLIESYLKLVNRGIKPTRDELVKMLDLAANQGKSFDQLAEAALDATTGEFERLREFGIRAKKEGDQVELSFKGQTQTAKFTQEAILDVILGYGELSSVQGSAAAGTDNLTSKTERLGGMFERLLANLGQGGIGDVFGDLVDNVTALIGYFVELTDVQGGLTKEVVKAQAQFNIEIETLQRGNISADSRSKIIESINNKYEDYLPNLLEETASLEDLKAAQDAANESFNNRIILLAAEQQLAEVAERQLRAKSEELELEVKLTEARKRTLNAGERAQNNSAQSTQQFAGVRTAAGISGDSVANDLAKQAEERVKANRDLQAQLADEFERSLAAAKELGVNIDNVLNPKLPGSGGAGGGGGDDGDDLKQTISDRLSAISEGAEVERELVRRSLLNNTIDQKEAGVLLGEIRLQQFRSELDAYATFGLERTAAAEKVRNDLIEATKPRTDTAVNELPETEIAQAESTAKALGDIDEALITRRISLFEREKKVREELKSVAIGAAKDTSEALIEFLGRDEEARKKNAKVIKAFQKGEVLAAGFAEVQQIYLATSKEAAAVSGIPGAQIPVILKGAIKAGAAIARTAVNAGKIAATKFARGGTPKFGLFGGQSHAQGGNRGIFEDGTQIEVEKDETFAVVNKRAKGLLGLLSRVNAATGGVPFFNRGGIALDSPSTQPIISPAAIAASAAPAADNTELLDRIDRLTAVTANMQTEISARVVYGDVETAGSDLERVRALARV